MVAHEHVKLEARVQFLVHDRIFLFKISQLANRGLSSDNQIFNITSLRGRKHELFFHYWSFKYMNACLYMT